jgi:putative peptidoglycan lipid II flippase
LIASVVNIALNAWLVKWLGVAGLALAFSISSIVQFALLIIFLRIEIGHLDSLKLLRSLARMLAAVAVAGLVVTSTKAWW